MIPPTWTRRILPLDAPLATPFRATLPRAPLSHARQIASPISSLPNREVVQPSHAPQLPVARRIFQLFSARARPAHPQPFQNLAKQPRCSSHFDARIAIVRPVDASKFRRPHRNRAAVGSSDLFPRCVFESQHAKSTSPRAALLRMRQRQLATHRHRAAS